MLDWVPFGCWILTTIKGAGLGAVWEPFINFDLFSYLACSRLEHSDDVSSIGGRGSF